MEGWSRCGFWSSLQIGYEYVKIFKAGHDLVTFSKAGHDVVTFSKAGHDVEGEKDLCRIEVVTGKVDVVIVKFQHYYAKYLIAERGNVGGFTQ
eukprot:scaffold3515_cov126-Cylindrotheca_fusiformis.AAC.45